MRLLSLAALLLVPAAALAGEEPASFKSFDGFMLDASLAVPDGVAARDVTRVIVFIHGSGPSSKDGDLTEVTKGKAQNLWFRDVKDALVQKGFAVLRYDKRTYTIRQKAIANEEYLREPTVTAYLAEPLRYIVDDAAAAAREAAARCPKAALYLLGHSEGTYVALQVAATHPEVKGVALVGFMAIPMDALILEQTLYRPLETFAAHDANHDGQLAKAELAASDTFCAALLPQFEVLDQDGDGLVSRAEVQGGNLAGLFGKGLLLGSAYRAQAARYPNVDDILIKSSFKAAFFNGLWDNQTPAYGVLAVKLAAKHLWQKDNFRFHLFPRLGHALDPRDAYDDVVYQRIDPAALKALGDELGAWF